VLERRSREKSSWCPATKIDRSISSEKDDYELKPYGLASETADRNQSKGIIRSSRGHCDGPLMRELGGWRRLSE
jgi:hypothetical protein